MHKTVLGIGSNTDARFNIKQATDYLRFYFPNIKFTSTIETMPYGDMFTTPFVNALAYFKTDLSKDEILLQLKLIEKTMGRLPSHKEEGIVVIDIDLVQWNNEILKPDDYKRNYIKQLLLEMQEIIGYQL